MDDSELSLQRQEQVLIANRDFIIKHLNPDDVIDELIQERLIGEDSAQRIRSVTSRVDKNRIILEQLSIAGPGTVESFCDILKKRRQTVIAEKLGKCKCDSVTEQFTVSSYVYCVRQLDAWKVVFTGYSSGIHLTNFILTYLSFFVAMLVPNPALFVLAYVIGTQAGLLRISCYCWRPDRQTLRLDRLRYYIASWFIYTERY